MLNFFRNLVDDNARFISQYQKIVEKINALEDQTRALKDDQFKEKTAKWKEQLSSDQITLESILPEAYALVREAARRTLGIRHYDVQLLAGIAMNDHKVVEQKTGEGKTLTATTTLYLNALTGKGAHLVTVNDYLARRDAGWMGSIFHFLGLQTSAIISGQSFLYDHEFVDDQANDWRLTHLKPVTRKEAYQADITYGINSEFGFDFLRDNMAVRPEHVVQRDYHFVIVDEADSVLIDEARTPHIISAPFDQDTSKYYQYVQIVSQLDPETDYVIDEKLRTAHLSEAGIDKIETILGVDNMYEKDFEALFHIEAALKARVLFKKDKDYIVNGGDVIIVDEFTGRLLEGRRFSEGLHQAIEAKEGVQIKRESRTLATVSLQNYFRMYKKLAGMTGTAATEAEEFRKIYSVQVVSVPTNQPVVRQDVPDIIYKKESTKFEAIAMDVKEQQKNGRPVLIGTASIEKNETLSRVLSKHGVKHELLNAKNHEREAQIIAQAGEKGAVTIATNMAGRGVDIILGGAPPNDEDYAPDEYKKRMHEWREKHDEVIECGGLYVIGTERHESRRIDNQLRGRSGRQGDPGRSCFYVSLEDDLMRIFGGEQITKLMNFFNLPEDQPLSHGMVSKAIEQSQTKVEGFNFDMRKHLVEYDDVLNRQRDILYSLRRKVLMTSLEDYETIKDHAMRSVKNVIVTITTNYFAIQETLDDEEDEKMVKDFEVLFPGELPRLQDLLHKSDDQQQVIDFLTEKASTIYDSKHEEIGKNIWNQVVKTFFLTTIDRFWTQHLTAIADLRQGINLRAYGQLNPLIEYKKEAFRMFEELISNTHYEITRRILQVQIKKEQAEQIAQQDKSLLSGQTNMQAASGSNAFKQPSQQTRARSENGSSQQQLSRSQRRMQEKKQKTVQSAPQTQKKKKRRR